MKQHYEAPTAEKIAFQYQEQVAASGPCTNQWINIGDTTCSDLEWVQNLNA